MRLYHGSIVAVRKPNVSRGRSTVDFGRGFYTTTSYEQAVKWAELKMRREGSARAVVSVYEAPDDILDGQYSVRRFTGADGKWLDFVVANRRGQGPGGYDLTMGPVANDQLYAAIRLYEQHVITAAAAIEMLKAHTLFDQLAFHSPEVAGLLRFVEAVEVHVNDR